MAQFNVISVVDGDTFDVSPQWQWNGQTGSRVRPAGYDTPELGAYGWQASKDKLERLVLGKTVELGTGYRLDRGRLVCDVYLHGQNLAGRFGQYQ